STINKIFKALKLVPEIHNIRKLKIIIKDELLSISHKSIEFSEALTILISVGLLKFDSAVLKKIDSNTMFSIENASSGEQCVIISMLGISSVIEDNSLIMIDEPEVCLHPEWQEKYIQLLTSIFSSYKGCQFIIATHSPQIVSNLSEKGCYIMTMEDGVAKDANEYINKSSDFQLATLFGSPGFKNEYLSRIAVNLFSNVSSNRKFTSNDIAIYQELINMLPKISEEDPLSSLIKAIEKMREIYA
ncbi:AAA family ATPase, partial [Pantoea latae]